jgi:hypothetical protein
LRDAKRESLARVRITGLNLIGTGTRQSIFSASERFTTLVKMEVRIYESAFRWSQSRTFGEFRAFYERLRDGAAGKRLAVRYATSSSLS